MSVLVVGSVAIDSIETPHGNAMNVIGGSATHFSVAASFFSEVRLVGVVGRDFPKKHINFLAKRGVDLAGLERAKGKTFFWHGRYSEDMNTRETISVELNVFEQFKPKVPEEWKSTPYVFLANGSPTTQLSVLDQMKDPAFVLLDSMDLWIETQREELMETLSRVHGVLLNDSEARLLTEQHNLIKAGQQVLSMGPGLVVLKKGEHGAIIFSKEHPDPVPVPAYPVAEVMDPTGAGDSFAGGLMGTLAAQGKHDLDAIKQGVVNGTVVASYNVEDFAADRMARLNREEIDERRSRFVESMKL